MRTCGTTHARLGGHILVTEYLWRAEGTMVLSAKFEGVGIAHAMG